MDINFLSSLMKFCDDERCIDSILTGANFIFHFLCFHGVFCCTLALHVCYIGKERSLVLMQSQEPIICTILDSSQRNIAQPYLPIITFVMVNHTR
mmetsp:Transcript_24727/g.51123  ORF Transcript_24727/g.51123 Transcript_24727/m.51123 type:complete len:95 (+) Transcript_24727:730-1014(+)